MQHRGLGEAGAMLNGRSGRRQMLGGVGATAALAMLPARTLAQPAVQRDPSGLDALARDMDGRLIRPGEPGFTMAALPNNARWADVRPVAVAMRAGAADVGRCVTWARNSGTRFAIRSGGHNYAGFSITDGLLIDVKAMNRATLDLANGTANAEGGANNQDVATALRVANFAIPSGRCPTVGVGGLVLGGG
jgi:FAD/FMN-containing dehydrogenase